MSDANAMIAHNTREEVAYKLLRDVATAEGWKLYGIAGSQPTRKQILDSYAECLMAVFTPNSRLSD